MKAFALTLAVLFLAGSAQAGSFTCNVPTAYDNRLAALCDDLKSRNRLNDTWDNQACVDFVFWTGVGVLDNAETTAGANETRSDTIVQQRNTFEVVYPDPNDNPPPGQYCICGDGTTANCSTWEECDEGASNGQSGATCDGGCNTVPTIP